MVLGGGVSGLTVAWRLARAGVSVVLLERSTRLGGLAADFHHDGRPISLAYHHVLSTDGDALRALRRLGLASSLSWKRLEMGFSMGESIHDLETPWSALRFPMSWSARLGMARLLFAALMEGPEGPDPQLDAGSWIARCSGGRLSDGFIDRLIQLKFGQPTSELSAAWLHGRLIHREGRGRYGYLRGTSWTHTMVQELLQRARAAGAQLRTEQLAVGLRLEGQRVRAVQLADGSELPAEVVVSTLPIPCFMDIAGRYPDPAVSQMRYTGVVSSVVATRQAVPLRHYWTNFLEPGLSFGGIFRLELLNESLGPPGGSLLNFVRHVGDRGPGSVIHDAPELHLRRFLNDFQRRFGQQLDPLWQHTVVFPWYSPVFVVGYRNPPARSSCWENLYFAGNFRTFPRLATTGTAIESAWRVSAQLLQDLEEGAV